ncbi:hypothetical protein A2V71_01050 [Candidatus Berkelbacteria bacterium RBG_13_40_8]|uniref:Sortase n=1 Tax=Candidatus Berkelbacteria bacterium RBG_13_40_8 TaxID=1797467 RepID=A0A1F5DNZ4_9BACT|nr:MAG: hypothetical protein A2V71_01050 [Candidatus Berkelbacteria bacterium RBG_13_40_8]
MKILLTKILQNLKKFKYVILGLLILIIIGTFGISQNKEDSTRASTPTTTTETKPQYTIFHLVIPKLDMSVPIIPDVDGNDKEEYFKSLESGVAHYKGTSKPGDGSNIFIFGHSSFYWWSPGDYKEIFKTLSDLEEGDEIIVWREGKEYKYKVTETKLVSPTDVSVLKPTKTEQVTLMTCWPPGTTQRRLIIIAKPI